MVTNLFAGTVALIGITLTLWTLLPPKAIRPGYGASDEEPLPQGNPPLGYSLEYVPMALLLIYQVESRKLWNEHLLLCVAGLFLGARLVHAFGRIRGNLPARRIGMGVTFFTLMLLVFSLLSTVLEGMSSI